MARAVSYGDIYAARDQAIAAAAEAGDTLPVLSFLERYGNYLPASQLNILGQQFFQTPQADYESKTDYFERLKSSAFLDVTAEGPVEVDTLVRRINPDTGEAELRVVRSLLDQGEGSPELRSQIESVLEAWSEKYGGEGFTVVAPVWRTY